MFETKILGRDRQSINFAAGLLKNGEVVGIPTETVYGLAANAFDENAVRKIFAAKGRPADNPLIVHVSETEQISHLVKTVPQLAYKCAEKFWPGPLTMIMPKSDKIPLVTSGGLDTVGIRMPSHETARQLISACGFPLAAPSANLSGSPSPTTAQHVFDDMNGRIPAIIDGGNCDVGVESTVISFDGNSIRLLRPGYISVEDLRQITENVIVDNGVLEKIDNNTKVRSPGMKYKHYAPKAEVTIVIGSAESFRRYVKKYGDEDTVCMVFDESDGKGLECRVISYGKSNDEQAKELFDVLRELDKIGAKKVFARCPRKDGVGLAVYNRLLRAAAFRVVNADE